MPTLEDAIQLALTAHRKQENKDGTPYILHPLRVMMQMDNRDEERQIIAILHDVVEDSEITLEDLRAAGYSECIVVAVDALTRRPDEDYMEYVQRVAKNDLARPIKIADLEDNMDVRRLAQLGEKDIVRLHRYHAAWWFLQN